MTGWIFGSQRSTSSSAGSIAAKVGIVRSAIGVAGAIPWDV
ncbi:hypothetical protein [Pendulispora albinea]